MGCGLDMVEGGRARMGVILPMSSQDVRSCGGGDEEGLPTYPSGNPQPQSHGIGFPLMSRGSLAVYMARQDMDEEKHEREVVYDLDENMPVQDRVYRIARVLGLCI